MPRQGSKPCIFILKECLSSLTSLRNMLLLWCGFSALALTPGLPPSSVADSDFLVAESASNLEDVPIIRPLNRNGYPIYWFGQPLKKYWFPILAGSGHILIFGAPYRPNLSHVIQPCPRSNMSSMECGRFVDLLCISIPNEWDIRISSSVWKTSDVGWNFARISPRYLALLIQRIDCVTPYS
jgi:hypothetical protein